MKQQKRMILGSTPKTRMKDGSCHDRGKAHQCAGELHGHVWKRQEADRRREAALYDRHGKCQAGVLPVELCEERLRDRCGKNVRARGVSNGRDAHAACSPSVRTTRTLNGPSHVLRASPHSTKKGTAKRYAFSDTSRATVPPSRAQPKPDPMAKNPNAPMEMDSQKGSDLVRTSLDNAAAPMATVLRIPTEAGPRFSASTFPLTCLYAVVSIAHAGKDKRRKGKRSLSTHLELKECHAQPERKIQGKEHVAPLVDEEGTQHTADVSSRLGLLLALEWLDEPGRARRGQREAEERCEGQVVGEGEQQSRAQELHRDLAPEERPGKGCPELGFHPVISARSRLLPKSVYRSTEVCSCIVTALRGRTFGGPKDSRGDAAQDRSREQQGVLAPGSKHTRRSKLRDVRAVETQRRGQSRLGPQAIHRRRREDQGRDRVGKVQRSGAQSAKVEPEARAGQGQRGRRTRVIDREAVAHQPEALQHIASTAYRSYRAALRLAALRLHGLHILPQEGRRLAQHVALLVQHIPHQRVADVEALASGRHPETLVVLDEALRVDGVQEPLALGSVGLFGGFS
eukprot:scaffold1282_cov251-Pinguiococcus_pyrenoidosus.AAC.10